MLQKKPRKIPRKIPNPWFVYILECENGRLYTGITTDLDRRFQEHRSGQGAMFTRLNQASRMLAALSCKDRSEASKREWAIKQLGAKEKRALASQWPIIF
jgi:putative endonuclease